MEECKFEGCSNAAKSKGLCIGHYQQQWRGKALTPLQEHKRRPNESFCLQCNTQKAREDFYFKTNGRTLQNECKDCMKARAKRNRDETKKKLDRLAALETA